MRRCLFLISVALLAASTSGLQGQQSCNPVVCENQLPGNPSSEWDISGAGDPNLQGFATSISVNKGETVHFKVDTTASSFQIDIYRLGYYGGRGARKVATAGTFAGRDQAACLTVSATGLIDCGNWLESASWLVPADAVSGVYLAKLSRADTGGASHVVFVVRDDAAQAEVLFQTSDATWAAYNQYGGNSLYVGGPGTNPGRAYKVSYNRPFTTRATGPEDWLFNAEYPMIRWLEANGFNVSYFTGVDTDRVGGTELFRHRVFLSVGHDEYWSGPQRANVEAARNAGVNLAFFSGNEMFWKTRWESSIDGTNTPYRTLVSYKETHANKVIDPADPPIWTGTWRDPRFSPPADGGRPENAVTGTLFIVNCCTTTAAIRVTQTFSSLPFWRNTRVATLPSGGSTTLTAGTLGYEWDNNPNNGFRPAGLTTLATTTVSASQVLQDNGSTYAAGSATHALTQYRHQSGALVFGAGTVQWSWGLDGSHDRGGSTPDLAMQQATINLLADMGVQPGSLQPGLVSGSTDTTAPTVSITAPAGGATVSGSAVAVTASAADNVGVVGVQFKLDGANLGAEDTVSPYTLTWNSTTATDGAHTLTAVARDAAGNQKTSTAVAVTVANDPTPPAVSMTAPAVGATVSGAAVSVTASASDNVGVVGVQFSLDGVNLGTEDTASPYAVTWNTTTAANGGHSLTATARDAAGNHTTSAAVGVTVSNTVAPPPAGIAVDATAFGDRSTAATTIATNTFATAFAGELLLAFVSTDDTASGGQQVNSVTGGGLTWQMAVRTNAQRGTSEIWRAFAPATLSAVSVTATLAQSAAASITVVTFTGADSSGTNGSGAVGATKSASASTGAPTGSLVTTRGGSLVVAVGNDWDNNTARTIGSGQTLVHQYLASVGDAFWVQRMSATTPAAGTTVTLNDTAPTGDRFNLSLCEILPAQAVSDATPPTVSLTAPAGGATVSGTTTTVSATAADNVAVAGVQFKLDGANLGAEVTAAPYTLTWNTTTTSNGSHTLTAIARDAAGNPTTSAAVIVTVSNDPTPPTASLTAPTGGATVSGTTVAVSATAADNVSVAGVQFKLDGANLGAEVTVAPYTVTWNTAATANGSHTLTAVARDAAGNTTTAAAVTVTVSNAVPANLTVNGSTRFQTIDGFGVNLNPKLWNNGQLIGGINQLVDLMGVNIVRVDALTNSWWELGNDDGNPFNYNWTYYNQLFESTNFRNVWSTIEYLNRRHVTVIFSAQGLLPSWMGGTVLNTAQEDEFAEMFAAAVYYARSTRGLTVSLLDPMNEVDLGSPEGPSMSTTQYARVARKILDRLVALGLDDVKFVPPETVGATAYLDAVVADAVLAAHVDVAGFHAYTGVTPSLAALSGRRLWMTEWSNSTTDGFLDGGKSVANEWTFAKTEADYLLNHLRDGASAALKWDAIDNIHEHDPSGAVTKWGALAYDVATQTMTPRKRLYTSAIVFRFVQPGMSRVSVSTTSGVTVYGFYDPILQKLSLVGHNTSGSAVVLTGALSNVGAVTALSSYTTNSGSANVTRGVDVAVTGGGFSYSVPADTFFALTSGTVPAPVDTQVPVVSFSAPVGGAVSGLICVEASATDDQTITAVQILVDGSLFDAVFDAPYVVPIDTRFLSNGSHTVTAIAWDGVSQSASASMTLNVSNASTKSLVAAYGFGENSGLLAGDTAGNVGAGFLNGVGWTSSGKFGSGLSFSGQGLMIVNDSPYLHLGTGMTLEAWVMPSSSVGKRAVLFKERQGVPSYALYSNNAAASAGPAQGRITDTLMNTTVVSGVAAVTANSWTHLALTHDGTNLRLYTNGLLTSTTTAPAVFNTNGPLYLGGNVYQGDYFAGVIDEVRIYNRALASQEIVADMNSPVVTDTTAPTVTITAPVDGATVTGASVTVSASAADNLGVAGVQFTVDGVNLGSEVLGAPYSVPWNTTGLTNGTHVVAATARDGSANSASASVSVTVNNPPIVSGVTVSSITQSSATISWTTNAAANSVISYGLTSAYGSSTVPDPTLTTSHAQAVTGLSPSMAYHFQVASTDASNNQAVSPDGVFTTAAPPDTVAPTVSMTAPAGGATVSGSAVTVSATAGDNVAVVGVQFRMDGVNIGAEDTTSPYSVSWNTTTILNGSHALTAVARDAAGNTMTAGVTVTVSNAVSAGLAIHVAASADQPSVSSRTVATSLTTTVANTLLVAFIAADDQTAGNTVSSVTGGGLTWQFVARTNAQRGVSEVWRAFATVTIANASVTATLAQAAASAMTVVAFTGADITGTSGSGAIGAVRSASGTGAPTGTLTTTRNNSWVFAVGNDWSTATARTLGTGQTMVHQYLAPVGDTYWVQRLTGTTPVAGTVVTANDTAPTGDRYNLTIVEILPQ